MHSTLCTATISIFGLYVFSYTVMTYTSTPVYLSIGGLNSHTFNYGYGGVLSGTVRSQVFQTSEGLVASISTEVFCRSEGEFLNLITIDRLQTRLR